MGAVAAAFKVRSNHRQHSPLFFAQNPNLLDKRQEKVPGTEAAREKKVYAFKISPKKSPSLKMCGKKLLIQTSLV